MQSLHYADPNIECKANCVEQCTKNMRWEEIHAIGSYCKVTIVSGHQLDFLEVRETGALEHCYDTTYITPKTDP